MTTYSKHLPDEEATEQLGQQLAALLRGFGLGGDDPPWQVHLRGTLGAGKTTVARGLLRALGHQGPVKSPTYTLLEPYEVAGRTIYHFDLYRLGDPEELEFMGVRDYLDGASICLIEWPQRGAGVLPPADLVITIEPLGSGRRLRLEPATRRGIAVVAELRRAEPAIEP